VILVGLFIAGLGIAMQWPLGMARVARASDHQNDRAASFAAVAAGVAGGIAPFTLGALSDRVGIEMAFLVAPATLILALVLVTVSPVAVSDDLELSARI
jgi:MFS family permease